MCSVQVVLFAEVMGRSSELRRPGAGVCRRLFSTDVPPTGAADPGRFLRAMEAELRRRDTERWNFDFQKEKPLPGRYQWVPMKKQTTIEKPLEELDVKLSSDCNKSSDVKDGEDAAVIVNEVRSPKVAGSNPLKRRKSSSSAGAVANQAKITDFLKKRKRTETVESSTNKLKMRRLSSTMVPSSPTVSPSLAQL